ncbi:hypothetical protein OPT61_g4267 [Boeremia exigua]|uniref:Uncharacterized protein n=1 Tax=Boeremia exigua TaxID=749465 RepID=A0ACC2IEM0_9PLEO|nr:hypothetical protein OPT61_g4267 [Boeremia exigua]
MPEATQPPVCPGPGSRPRRCMVHGERQEQRLVQCLIGRLAEKISASGRRDPRSRKPHLTPRHNSDTSAPGCWKGFVAQWYTLVSHQPGLGLRQLSTGHGAICWSHRGSVSMAPAYTACHYLGLTSALVEGTVADNVVHVASAPPNARKALHGALLQEARFASFSGRYDTVQPVPGTAENQWRRCPPVLGEKREAAPARFAVESDAARSASTQVCVRPAADSAASPPARASSLAA